MKVVIIGGGSAGTTCAFQLRKLDKEAEITILEKTENTEYSPCALPYVISGEIKDFKDIFIFTKDDYEKNNINLCLNSTVQEIDKETKKITYSKDNKKEQIQYDKLVLATGSSSFIPPIEGLDNTDYYSFKTIEDAQKISNDIKEQSTSVVVGAGMIGVELAHSLAERGENVKLIEIKENILPGILDPKISKKLKEHLEQIEVYEGRKIEKISGNELYVGEEKITFDKLFLCTGIRPNIELAKEIGLETDKGIVVNEFMQTSDKNIYACGDCAESTEFNSGQKMISALGTTATRQAKVIAKNLLGENEKFPFVLNNTVTKLGNLYVGAVGLSQERAKELDIKTISAEYTGNVKAEYYPSESKIRVKIICDSNGKILGGQIVGDEEVVGRLNLLSLAISKQMHVQELADMETCYNPASSPVFDPLNITAQICLKKLNLMGNRNE